MNRQLTRCLPWVFLVIGMNRRGLSVYVADTKALQDEELFRAGYRMVPSERREKADRFIFRKDKTLSIAAGLLLKKGLRDRGISEYSVSYGPNGKPFLMDFVCGIGNEKLQKPVHFNLSHSEEKVMCVISDAEVGCDVEKITDIDLEIAKRFFFTTEYETIVAGETPNQQRELFYRLWTLKESFMKATGLGMALPLDSFRVDLLKDLQKGENTQTAVLCHHVNGRQYHLKEYDMKDGYRYAVCISLDSSLFPLEMEVVELSQIK